MKRETMDKILATEEELIPSSGFLASVMERVHEEAAAPPPIPFPWARAVPAIVVAAVVLGGGAVELVRLAIPAVKDLALNPPHVSAAVTQPLEQAGWVALALTASLLSWLLSRRLAGRSGLL
ncbi:MAG: hypothetical protein P4K97_00535 [Terracidiphilus sp.]|nr:hypothetical protein [Terracidiphilus sp.]